MLYVDDNVYNAEWMAHDNLYFNQTIDETFLFLLHFDQRFYKSTSGLKGKWT